MFKVVPSVQFEEAFEDIEATLAGFAHESDILKVTQRSEEVAKKLAEMPTRHRLFRFAPPAAGQIRCANAGKYVIYFTVDEPSQTVGLLDVQHRKRSLEHLRRRMS